MKKVRGVWLTNVGSDVLDSKPNIEAAIKLLAETGFNAIFPVVWNKGYTLYPSAVMEKYFGTKFKLDPKYQAQGRDPLKELVAAASQYKMRVIPWFEYGFASSHISLSDADTVEFRKLLKQKQWVAFKHDGVTPLIENGFEWMNALNPDVQAFMIELMVEVVQNYDVDGIQGDDRLPAFPVEGFDQAAANQFEGNHGRFPTGPRDPDWMQFRADILTDFLRELCKQVRAVGSGKGKKLLISMAPHPRDFGFRTALQDTKAWFDLVDMMHPQLYRKTFKNIYDGSGKLTATGYKDLADSESRGLSANQKAKVSPGVLLKSGDYRIGKDPAQPENDDPQYLSKAVKLNQSMGFAGEIFFFFEGLRKPDGLLAKELRDSLYNIIQLDDEGPDVFRLQNLLAAKGFLSGKIDGIFGGGTEKAVKDFQALHFPPPLIDGKVGIKTLQKLGISDFQTFGQLPV